MRSIERSQQIKRLLLEGKTVKEIAAITGLTQGSIRHYRFKLFGKQSIGLLDADKQMIKQLYVSGISPRAISQKTGVSLAAVYKHMHKTQKTKGYLSDDEKREIALLAKDGWSISGIARKICRSRKAIRDYLQEIGIYQSPPLRCMPEQEKLEPPDEEEWVFVPGATEWEQMLNETTTHWRGIITQVKRLQMGQQYIVKPVQPGKRENEWPYCIRRPMIYEGVFGGKNPKLSGKCMTGRFERWKNDLPDF